MKKCLFALMLVPLTAHAWKFGMKTDYQQVSTDNAYLSNTNPTKDTYSAYSGYVQAKGESFRLRLKGKYDSYKVTTDNSNYKGDLSFQYKPTKSHDYTISGFDQVYNKIPQSLATDYSSDNYGGKLGTSFNEDFSKKVSGYVSFAGTYKNYNKFSDRKDTALDVGGGFDFYPTPDLSFSIDGSYTHLNSSNSYYKNVSYGPGANITLMATDNWEFFINYSYLFIKYGARTVSTVSKGVTIENKETQNLMSADVGTIYTVADIFPLQVKYSISENSSNRTTAAYQARMVSFGIGIKF